jgi:hypothetical protein
VSASIARQRLVNQRITRAGPGDPAKVVAWLGAVQGQEYGPTKWSLGLRLPPGLTDAAVERAIDRGRILRTHVLRPTWHLVTPADIRWMLELTAPQVHRTMVTYDRQLGLDAAVMTRATGIIERALGEARYLTRRELGAHLERAGLPGKSTHLAHIAMYAELEGVICSGPRRGTQLTYALLSDHVPSARRLSREEAVAELARRYFRSHGPATVRDFAWWSGLKVLEAKRGLEMNRAQAMDVDGLTYWGMGRTGDRGSRGKASVHLLPVYDEYLVAYRDRLVVPHTLYSSWGANIRHALVISGQIAGTWRSTAGSTRLMLEIQTSRRLTLSERRELTRAARRYGRFVGLPLSLSVV